MRNLRLDANILKFSFEQMRHDLYPFSLDLTHGGQGPELVTKAAANVNPWHRRLGHLDRSLDHLKNLDNNGVGFDGLCQTVT